MLSDDVYHIPFSLQKKGFFNDYESSAGMILD